MHLISNAEPADLCYMHFRVFDLGRNGHPEFLGTASDLTVTGQCSSRPLTFYCSLALHRPVSKMKSHQDIGGQIWIQWVNCHSPVFIKLFIFLANPFILQSTEANQTGSHTLCHS